MKQATGRIVSLIAAVALVAVGALVLGSCAPAAPKVSKIAIVVKSLGNGFFDAVRDGGQEAAKELGNTEIIYQGPSTPTAEGQIEIIDSLIAQKVQGIAISANDRDALIPITKKAMSKGIKVISFDSGISKDGRMVDLVPSVTDLIGKQQVELVSGLVGGEGEIAILSATSQATNQNAWIDVMKAELASNPAYAKLKLVATVYGDDLADKSYREAVGLFEAHPKLKGIIAPTTVGIAAAGKAITDKKLIGKVQLTGLGLPSEMKFYVDNGACQKFALWNPIDLGYTSVQIVNALIKKQVTGKDGDVVKAGRMGDIKIGADGGAVMGVPFVFDKTTIEKFSKMF
jgi:rhamnose transport system substrate-binding protein